MPTRDIVVIGGSAGGVEALMQLANGLPGDFPAAVFAVLHISPNAPSMLPAILRRAGALPADHAKDGERIQPGRIYLPLPDHHLLIDGDRVCLTKGPKENTHRPAADPLFRSAAVAHGPRVIGVIISGNLDDGTAGLLAIKHQGGVAVVQNPNEAIFSGMPLSAIENVSVDHVVPLHEIPGLLLRLTREQVSAIVPEVPPQMRMEAEIAKMDLNAMQSHSRPGAPAGLSCPECSGTLFELREGELTRYRCRVGHGYSMETLMAEQAESIEAALWSAMVALKEKAVLSKRMMGYMRKRGHDLTAARFEQQANDAEQRAQLIQDLLETRLSEPGAEPARPDRRRRMLSGQPGNGDKAAETNALDH